MPRTDAPLSATPRTRLTRERHHQVEDRGRLHALLGEALIGHLAIDRGGFPVAMPIAYAIDLDGPDDGGTVYLHASVAAGWMAGAAGRTVSLTVTEIDGLVAARSGFNHSMNYRAAVIIGETRVVSDEEERGHALDLIVDHMIPGRAATLRPATRKELAATQVLALPLAEASLKVSEGDPDDEPEDVAAGIWAGVIPVRRIADAVVPDPQATGPVPADVRARAEALADAGPAASAAP
ncbi:MAG TPA: pyridoxamine 5'-phosphate oxidase family protein, partial [Nocardioides sp.]|nr:pyridoxamine 5'-phosphate oxidase family protein [Nocardioides sp.]